jgi:hypothetical protein
LFGNIVEEMSGLRTLNIETDQLPPNTELFWRVKSFNDSGESNWSEHAVFKTSDPFIELTSPNGGEVLSRGLDYFIEWKTNVMEDVVLLLYKDNTIIDTIAVTKSNNAYKWSLPVNLEETCGYQVRIKSSLNENLTDRSDSTFAVNDSSCISTNVVGLIRMDTSIDFLVYPNPAKNNLYIEYNLKTQQKVSIDLYNIEGIRIRNIISNVSQSGKQYLNYELGEIPSGIYIIKIQMQNFIHSKLVSFQR